MTAPASYITEMRACAEAIGLGATEFVQPEDRWVNLNGLDVHYLDWGNSHLPPLVLLHGGALTAHTWDMAALLLRDAYHVIAPDQRGHGDTGWTPEEQLAEDNNDLMAADTEAFIDHLGYPRVILCGMSMGGQNAIRYAAGHPARLGRLIVVDIAPVTMVAGALEMEAFRKESETLRDFEAVVQSAIRFNPSRKPEHLRYSLLHSLKQVPDGYTWKQDHRRRPGFHEELTEEQREAQGRERTEATWALVRAITTPTLLVRGEVSKITSKEAADDMVAAIPDAEHVVIAGAGHSVQGDNPKDFAAAVRAYLERKGTGL